MLGCGVDDCTVWRTKAVVAVLIPCYNEAATVAKVVGDFRRALPDAKLYVFDNNSTDDTADIARQAGAHVRVVLDKGKGNVVRRMFADIYADAYVLVDGDGTYDATAAPRLIGMMFANGLDMVVGTRTSNEREAYRWGHRFGNRLLTQCVARIFGHTFSDMLSGYRVFSRRFVKSFPAHATGFETETELTVHALELRMPVAEVQTIYGSRPDGSESKLNTWRDGSRILLTIIKLLKSEKPLLFFSAISCACAMLSILLFIPIFDNYVRTGLVPRLPTVLLSTSLMLLGAILLVCGIVLDTVTHGRAEAKRLAYLAFPAPSIKEYS
ncbi:glycosyltransferase [Burkholderia diffusa]|uniref:glycosyltransferase n=1 Tax=Burkholderia diffusa TaxID=488732 RepID=UPI0007549A1F|nr:glycosyltransferase [Burkholderia diffusa]KVH51155.1 glycosyl transferase [Burkholderia diffusa]